MVCHTAITMRMMINGSTPPAAAMAMCLGLSAKTIHSGTVVITTLLQTGVTTIHSGTIATTIHSGTTAIVTHSGTIATTIHSGTTAIAIRSGTTAIVTHSGTTSLGTHSGTLVQEIRSGTTSKLIRSGTTVTITRSGTTCAILLYLTAFNTSLLQAAAAIIPMCRTPKYSMAHAVPALIICSPSHLQRTKTMPNLQD